VGVHFIVSPSTWPLSHRKPASAGNLKALQYSCKTSRRWQCSVNINFLCDVRVFHATSTMFKTKTQRTDSTNFPPICKSTKWPLPKVFLTQILCAIRMSPTSNTLPFSYILPNLIATVPFSNQVTYSSWISGTIIELRNKRFFSWAVIDRVLREKTIRTPKLIYNMCVYKGKKVKCSRYRPGVAQGVGRRIALLLHHRGTRRWVVSVTPRPHSIPGKDPVPILQEAG